MSGRVLVSKKTLIFNSSSTIVTRIFSVFVLIWMQQYLLKRISVEEYSLLPLISSIIIMLPFFVTILTGGIKRYVLEAYAKKDDDRIGRIVSTMFVLSCLGSIVLIAAGGTLSWQIDKILNLAPDHVDDARIMFMLMILVVAIRVPAASFTSGLYVQQRFVLQNLIIVIGECVRLILLLALLLGVSVSVISVVVATAAGQIVEIIALLVVSRRILPEQRFDRSKFDWSIAKDLTKFGGWSSLYGFFGMVGKAADPIILNRLSTPLDVTCFHLGGLVPNRLEVIVNQSVMGSVSPIVVGLHAEKEDQKLKNIYLRLGRFALWGLLLVVGPFLVHHKQIITLYIGDTYSAAGIVLLFLFLGYPVVYGNILYTSLANAKMRMRSLAIRQTASTIVNLVLTLVLVGYFQMGAIGAAIATFIVYGLGSIVFFWPFGKSMANASWSEILREIVLPGLAPFLCALLAMNLLTISYPVQTWIDIAFNSMLGASVHLVVVWFVAKEIDKVQVKTALMNLFFTRSA